MKKIDDWILAHVQAAYLWLFDRTGVYLGTCAMIVLVAGRAAWVPTRLVGPPIWLDVAIVLFLIYILHRYWRLQHARDYAQLNWRVELWRCSPIRRCMLLIWPIVPLSDVYHSWGAPISMLGALTDSVCGLVALFYLAACYTRDREPPEKRFNQPVSAGI